MINPEPDFDNLEISFTCASSYPVKRYDWWKDEYFKEILKISEEAIDMTRLNGGASVLKNHDSSIVLGKIVRAWVEDGALCVRIRFRTDNMSRDLFNDLASGTVPNVSIGYGYDPEKDVREYVSEDGESVREIEHWEAYEVSVAVGIPADPTVGFLRSADLNVHHSRAIDKTNTKKEVNMAKRELEPTESEEAREAETEETEETTTETADETKECGEEKDERALLMNEIKNLRSELVKSFAAPYIQTEKRQYSIASALQYMLTGKGADMEREISDEIYKRSGQIGGERSLMIPFNDDSMRGMGVFNRTFSGFANVSGGTTSGAGLVAQENKPEMFVDYVRSKIGVKNATFLTGLTGAPVTIPVQSTDTSVAWISGGTATSGVNEDVGATSPVVTNIELTPHKLGGYVPVGKDLILSGNPDAISVTMRSLLANVAHKLGTTMLKGNASNPAIEGLATATGVQTNVIATIGSATWANMLNFGAKVEGLEMDGELEFVMGPADKATFKSIAKGQYGSGFLCEDDRIDGHLVHVDGSLSSGDIYFGDFSNILVGQWGGIEMLIDPYTLALGGNVRVIISLVCDIKIRRPNTFVKRTDS